MQKEKIKDGQIMLTKPTPSLVLRVAIPTILGLLSNALFHLADAFFVSKLGTTASAAVGITFALQTLMQAMGYTFGTGGGALLSRMLGQENEEKANDYATLALVLAFSVGMLITLGGLLWAEPLLRFLGGSDAVIPYALDYLRIFLWSAPAVCAVFTLSQLLRSEGCAFYAMLGLIGGNLMNIVLDPILILWGDLGIAGAAWATLVGQWFGVLILLTVYRKQKSRIRLFHKRPTAPLSFVGNIIHTGIPSFLRQGLICLSTILLNHAAAETGEYAIAAMSVVNRIFLLTFSFCAGLGQGMMSVVGFNFGAGQWSRMKTAFQFALKTSTIGMLLFSLPLFLFSPQIIALFRNESNVIAFGSVALRLQMAVLFCHGAITCVSMFLQAIGKPLAASLVACGRQGVFFLPLFFFIPATFGLHAFRLVQPLSDLISFLFTLPFLFYVFRLLKKQEKNGSRHS